LIEKAIFLPIIGIALAAFGLGFLTCILVYWKKIRRK